MEYRTCAYVKTTGELCNAAALRESDLCYYHERDRQRLRNFHRSLQLCRFAGDPASGGFTPAAYQAQLNQASATLFQSLELPLLDDRAAIQVTLSNIVRALATRQIDRRYAALMLYAIQIAVTNLNATSPPDPNAAKVDTDPEPLLTPFEVDTSIPPEPQK
jgi:hypothetical protein